MMEPDISGYLAALTRAVGLAEASDRTGRPIGLSAAIGRMARLARESHRRGSTVIFIGNGGSAAIASHMAIDFCRSAEIRALAFNDGPALTCLANDFSFAEVFAKQLGFHGRRNDVLVAISSSGRSPDILQAVAAARTLAMGVVTLSGFLPENPLRRAGDLNFYVPARAYGVVELSHHLLCHAVVDHLSAPVTELAGQPVLEAATP